ncbi:general odorant-binding protein 19d-like [Teleopsis dalmanni]|uniref:general odorant-binding protein 19d-like n=1 Tax=Teleopsis dalmanni TaxID=139649 RepID=UPI0018CFE807|nr:general odorant-binding protein 19d-like [Teleopsis dalmanni]
MQATMKSTTSAKQFILLLAGIVGILEIGYVKANSPENAEPDAALQQLRLACKKSTNLSDADFNLMLANKLFTWNTSANAAATIPKTVKCYTACFLKRSDIILPDNKLNEAHIRQMITMLTRNPNKANATVEKCRNFIGSDECERAYGFELCLIGETGLYFL